MQKESGEMADGKAQGDRVSFGALSVELVQYTVKPLLKDTCKMQPPPLTGHHCSAPFEIPFIGMCRFESSEISTPPYTGQLTEVPMVSLLQRFHCTGQLTVVPMVSLLQRFHCTGQYTVVPMVSLCTIVPSC